MNRRLIQKDFDFMKASIEGVYSKYFAEKIETLYLDNKEYKKRAVRVLLDIIKCMSNQIILL